MKSPSKIFVGSEHVQFRCPRALRFELVTRAGTLGLSEREAWEAAGREWADDRSDPMEIYALRAERDRAAELLASARAQNESLIARNVALETECERLRATLRAREPAQPILDEMQDARPSRLVFRESTQPLPDPRDLSAVLP
jgi:hypothetical protein